MNVMRSCALFCFLVTVPLLGRAPRNPWITTWAASSEMADPDPDEPLLRIDDQTVRERLRVSVGGAQLCIRLSNEYGSAPLLIGSATVAMAKDAASVRPGSIQTVTFGRRNSVSIAAGAPVLSDPVSFPVAPGSEITISLYFPKRVATPTLHSLALKRALVSPHGDYTHAERIEGAVTESSILVSAVLVPTQPSQRLVVAFGDSVVDGDGSTVDADHNWVSDLISRLAKAGEGSKVAVVNEGVAGNRLLSDGSAVLSSGLGFGAGFGVSALARFDRDALGLLGVTHVVLLEGLNDIGFPGAKLNGHYLADVADVRSAEEIIDGYLQLISRAHARAGSS